MSQLRLTPLSSYVSPLAHPVSRGELVLWIVGALFANQAVHLLDFSSLSAFSTNLAQQNYIYWFGCYVVLYRLSASEDRTPAGVNDWPLAAAMMIAMLLSSLIAYRFTLGALETVVALYLLVVRRSDRQMKAAGIVLLALSAHLIWGPILFQVFTPELLRGDAAVVGGMLKAVRPDIVWTDTTFKNPDHFAVSLVGACSSFQNLSTAMLACAAATMFMRTEWKRSDTLRAVFAGVVMIFINDIRLCLLVWDKSYYDFWHQGAGAPLIGFVTTIALLAIAFSGGLTRQGRA
jgi:exosortase/archaeosortase family protein